MTKHPSPRNRTIRLNAQQRAAAKAKLYSLTKPVPNVALQNTTIHAELLHVLPFLPDAFVDLLILDPPYNKHQSFGPTRFSRQSQAAYSEWVTTWFVPLLRVLKPTATIYCCADWQTSLSIQPILAEHLILRNRITWEREKGRGAKNNWKSTAEDIWFATNSEHYTFNADAVKLLRKVRAPYREGGKPKDWTEHDSEKLRRTHPSNCWTDITVPFWSMPENTEHPTQKPEKLIAKLILASSNNGDVVFDPFLGSGTTSVVAKKLGRIYCGIEQNLDYCLTAEHRLRQAESDRQIQGYHEGIFWERNTK